jgi:hydroxypyruvate isomerase
VFTVNCSMLLTELPLLERADFAVRSGFTRVEFWWPFAESVPSDEQIDAFQRAIEDAGAQLTGINFASGSRQAGEHGLLSLEERSSEFLANVDIVVGLGERLGCKAFNALYGNRMHDREPQSQDEVALDNLAAAADAVSRIGGTILLEPLSGAERYPLKTARDALRVISRMHELGHRNVKLLADLFHLSATETSVEEVIDDHAADLGHVQIADRPGRGAPGTGTLPLREWVERVYSRGFEGNVGLEYQADIEDAFTWLSAGEWMQAPGFAVGA